MKNLKYKTTINCQGCVKAVTPYLNKEETIENWQVDTTDPNKILTVEGEHVSDQKVIEAVKKAGFAIEKIK